MAVTARTRPRVRGVTSAATVVARVDRAAAALAALGLGAAGLWLVRLLGTWHVGSGGHVEVLGQHFSYPHANVPALLVLALAVIGLASLALALWGAAREAAAAWRFSRQLARAGTAFLGDARVVEDERPLAFCAGLLRPGYSFLRERLSCSTTRRSTSS